MMITLAILERLLNDFGVDTQGWGKGKAKRVSSLLEEVQRGESHLMISDQGLTRVTQVVTMFISPPAGHERFDGYVLIEVAQILRGGQHQVRNRPPSEKLKRNESPQEGLLRGGAEELNIPVPFATFHPLSMVEEVEASQSYPNLRCLYRIYPFEATVYGSCDICNQQETEITEKDGTRHIFRWEPKQK